MTLDEGRILAWFGKVLKRTTTVQGFMTVVNTLSEKMPTLSRFPFNPCEHDLERRWKEKVLTIKTLQSNPIPNFMTVIVWEFVNVIFLRFPIILADVTFGKGHWNWYDLKDLWTKLHRVEFHDCGSHRVWDINMCYWQSPLSTWKYECVVMVTRNRSFPNSCTVYGL